MSKKEVKLPELGYTPANLRTLRAAAGLTQKQVAEICGVSRYDQVGRWEVEPESSARRADMPLEKWQELMAYVSDYIYIK